MKIFIICNSLSSGGAERVAVNMANDFAEHGHDITLITDLFMEQRYFVSEKVRLLNITNKQVFGKKRWIYAVKTIRKYIKEYKPQIIIGNMFLCSLLAKVAACGTKVSVIHHEHHSLRDNKFYKSGLWLKIRDYISFKIHKHIVELMPDDKEYLKNSSKVTVIPNALTFDVLTDVPQKTKTILVVARDDWHYKGLDILIKSWDLIAKNYPDWSLKIAGALSENTLNYLKSLIIDKETFNNLEFLGSRKDVIYLYRQAAIYVLSSRQEGLPMVLLEAMSQGCACISSDLCGRINGMIEDKEEGMIFDNTNVKQLSEKIEFLINDDAYRNKLQKKSLEVAKRYDKEAVRSTWEELFNKINCLI